MPSSFDSGDGVVGPLPVGRCQGTHRWTCSIFSSSMLRSMTTTLNSPASIRVCNAEVLGVTVVTLPPSHRHPERHPTLSIQGRDLRHRVTVVTLPVPYLYPSRRDGEWCRPTAPLPFLGSQERKRASPPSPHDI